MSNTNEGNVSIAVWIEAAVIIATAAKTLWDLYEQAKNDD